MAGAGRIPGSPRARSARRGLLRPLGGTVIALLAVAGCELTEMVVAHPEDVIIVEAYLQLTLMAPGADEAPDGTGSALVLVHRGGAGDGARLEGTTVLLRTGGERVQLPESAVKSCVSGITGSDEPFEGDARCFRLILAEGLLAPGQDARIEVTLPDGRRLSGSTTLPGEFRFLRPDAPSRCRLHPDTRFDLVWSSSDGAWAYATEATLENLREAFSAHDIVPPSDRLVLQGVSVSAADTTMTFPAHFGLFGRIGSSSRFLGMLQDGLPSGVRAHVALTAVDGNHVSWLRGGGFNPSGRVRVPSIFDEGGGNGATRATGVVGSSVRRMVTIEIAGDGAEGAPCAG